MDGNFKVRCTNGGGALNYTAGKAYEFERGVMRDDLGCLHHASNFDDWAKYSEAKWELVDESDNKKVGGFIHCKICKWRFELKKSCRYTAVRAESIFPLKTSQYDAFDCPHCGCQNIVGIREREEKGNEQGSVARETN